MSERSSSPRTGAPAACARTPALLWLNDPSKADVTLTQARAVAFGLGKLQFITRTGVRILLSQAAGIVISLLVAFSFVALVAAGTMLAAGAHAEVQRRLTGFGVQRALGFSPGRIAAQQAVEAAVVASRRPAGHRARLPRRRRPGRRAARRAQRARPRRWAPRALRCWPRCSRSSPSSSPPRPGPPGAPRAARRSRSCAAATSRPPTRARGARGGDPPPPGLFVLGVRFATAGARALGGGGGNDRGVCRGRDADALARVAAGAAAGGPGDGRQALPAGRVARRRAGRGAAIPGSTRSGSATASTRRTRSGSASRPARRLPGRPHGVRGPAAGRGALDPGAGRGRGRPGDGGCVGLRPGRVLAAQIPEGGEVRFRVSGRRARARERRADRVDPPDRLLALRPDLNPQVVVRVGPGPTPRRSPAASSASARRCQRSARRRPTTPPSSRCSPRCCAASGSAVGLVCLYALVQALTVTAREAWPCLARRGRAAARGRRRRDVGRARAGRLRRGRGDPRGRRGGRIPRGGRLRSTRGPTSPPGSPRSRSRRRAGQIALVAGGLLALAVIATALVARRVLREPVVAGLREK